MVGTATFLLLSCHCMIAWDHGAFVPTLFLLNLVVTRSTVHCGRCGTKFLSSLFLHSVTDCIALLEQFGQGRRVERETLVITSHSLPLLYVYANQCAVADLVSCSTMGVPTIPVVVLVRSLAISQLQPSSKCPPSSTLSF
mmetsp:Transcript_2304/g.15316  ORF Transcript_2304/g.15316 Transcript_2304/m.15316 type:complete len:140 (-) Transcript_2304:337-756(-)